MRALAKTKDPRALEALLAAVQGEQGGTRSEVVGVLGLFNEGLTKEPRTRPPLMAALQDNEECVREAAVRAISHFEDAQALEAVLGAVKDESPLVRWAAAGELGRFARTCRERLLAAVKDPNPYVRWGAAKALVGGRSWSRGGPVDAPIVEGVLNKDLAVIAGAYYVLLERGEPGTEPILIEALNKYGDQWMAFEFQNSGNENLAKAAHEWNEEALRKRLPLGMYNIGGYTPAWGRRRATGPLKATAPPPAPAKPDVNKLIRALRDDDGEARYRAARALEREGQSAVGPLVAALDDPDWRVRAGATQALRDIKPPGVLEYLMKMLKDKDGRVRQAASSAFNHEQDARAEERLIQALNDKDPAFRSGAARALGMIPSLRAAPTLIVVLRDEDGECPP